MREPSHRSYTVFVSVTGAESGDNSTISLSPVSLAPLGAHATEVTVDYNTVPHLDFCLFFFFVLGSHFPMSRKLLGDFAALLGGSAESYKVV